MSLTTQEEETLTRLLKWEDTMFDDEATDFILIYEKWLQSSLNRINIKIKERFLSVIDQATFYMNALLHHSDFQKNAEKELIHEAQVFSPNVQSIEDMKHLPFKQLEYLCNKRITKHQKLSLIQGGLTGTGGIFFIGIDLPLLFAINMHAVQYTALSYGYNTVVPFEMINILKILRLSVLPKRLKSLAWKELQDDIIYHDPYFYTGRDAIEEELWLDRFIRQIIKSFLIKELSKKMISGLPILGVAAGAGINYRFTKHVTDLAKHFYQKRFLMDKKGEYNGRI